MNDAPPAFLGRGWSFPPNFDRHAASVVMVSGDVDIRQSLWILMSTGLGERIMLAPYGCDLLPQVFRSLSATMAGAVSLMVKNAIVEWEPRVVVDRVAVTEGNDGSGGLDISIDYTVRQTNSRSNLVFPYYRREATIPGPVG
jgi:phage baseplate assembly protein W